MRAAGFIALKDLRLLLRDRVALFWVLGFPIAFAVLFGSVMSSALDDETHKVSVLLVDEAKAPKLTEALSSSGRLELTTATLERAKASVRRGEQTAYIRIPPGFGKNPEARLELAVDPARTAEAAVLRGVLAEAQRGGERPVAAVRELHVGSTKRSPYDLAFPAAVLWGLLGCAATFAVAMVSERTAGTDQRLRAAPIGRSTILAGKALACFIACLTDAALLVVLGAVALGVGVGNLVTLGLAVLSTTLCFVGITMLLSMLGTTEQSVAGAGWATLILMAMIGGAMVPLSAMPSWMLPLSDLSPVKWGIVALEGATWRSFSPAELLLPCLVLVGIGAVAFTAGLALLARRNA